MELLEPVGTTDEHVGDDLRGQVPDFFQDTEPTIRAVFTLLTR